MLYHVFGGGITGLTLAWSLAKSGHSVRVYERADKVGGTWRSNFTEGSSPDLPRLSQHSPQVVTASYLDTMKLFRDMGLNFSDYFAPHTTITTVLSLARNHIGVMDAFVMARGFLFYAMCPDRAKQVTVRDYFDSVGLSARGSGFLDKMTQFLDGAPSRIMTMHSLFMILDVSVMYPGIFKPNAPSGSGFAGAWFDRISQEFGGRVEWLFGRELRAIRDEGGSYRMMFSDPDHDITVARQTGEEAVLLAMDPLGLAKVMGSVDTSAVVRNNWGPRLGERLREGSYVSMPVTLHFDSPLPSIPDDVAYGFATEWSVVCVTAGFGDGKILACTVLDQDAWSSVLEKRVSDCDPQEVRDEVSRQVTSALRDHGVFSGLSVVEAVIDSSVSWDARRRQWSHHLSSATRTVTGSVDAFGDSRELAIVGSLNQHPYPITTMESAVQSALIFAVGGGSVASASLSQPRTLSRTVVTVLGIILVLTLVWVIWKYAL